MRSVFNAVRQALGGRVYPYLPARAAPPFFGTKWLLLQLFHAGIIHQQQLQQARASNCRRRGVSAKTPYATAKGTLPHPPRLGRAVGRGSYAALSPQQAVNGMRRLGLSPRLAHHLHPEELPA